MYKALNSRENKLTIQSTKEVSNLINADYPSHKGVVEGTLWFNFHIIIFIKVIFVHGPVVFRKIWLVSFSFGCLH